MPIYAYKCDSCGFAKDVLQKMSARLLTDCPACGAATFKKQLTSAGFKLKGSGWYATDFKGSEAPVKADSARADAVSSTAEKAKPAASSATKPETAPAPAAPTTSAGCGGRHEACACH